LLAQLDKQVNCKQFFFSFKQQQEQKPAKKVVHSLLLFVLLLLDLVFKFEHFVLNHQQFGNANSKTSFTFKTI